MCWLHGPELLLRKFHQSENLVVGGIVKEYVPPNALCVQVHVNGCQKNYIRIHN